MKKRWIVVGAIGVLFVGAIAVAAMNLDAWLEQNRPMIEEQASAAAGRKVEIGGLGVQIWGGFGVALSELRVADDPAYADGAFLTLQSGVVRVSIWPAIFGRIEVAEVVLESPEIRVIRDARGLSIDSLMAADDEAATEDEAGPDLEVSAIRIEQGRIVFEDRTEGGVVESVIERVDLVMQDVSANRPMSFELQASLLGATKANLVGSGTAGPLLAAADVPLAFDVALRLDELSLADVARLEDVASSLPEGTRLGGVIDATLSAHGRSDDIGFELTVDASRAEISLGSDFVKPASVAMGLAANGRALPASVEIERFVFDLAGARFEGQARVGLDEAGRFDATVRGEDVALAGWGELLPAMAGLPVEGRLGLDLRARGSSSSEKLPRLDGRLSLARVSIRLPDTPAVENLTARVDFAGARAELRETRFEVGGAPIEMQADIEDLNAPEVRFALDAAKLPLAALGVVEPGTEADDVLRELRVVGRADLRTEALVADARFASPGGRLQAIDYEDLSGRARLEGARMQLEGVSLRALGGTIAGSGTLDETEPDRPVYEGELDLAGVRIEELIRARYPAAGKLASGRIDTKVSLGAHGIDSDALLRSLGAKGLFRVRDGTLHDVNIAEEALSGATGVPGLSGLLSPELRKQYPGLFSTGDTRFKSIGAGMEIVKGLLQTNDFKVEADDFGLEGGGTIGLDGRVDLQTKFATSPALASSLVSAAGPARYLVDRSGRLTFPVRIEGTLASPKFEPDAAFVRQALARAAADAVGSAVSGLLGSGEPKKPTKQPTKQPTTEGATEADGKAAEAPNGSDTKKQPPSIEDQVQKGLEGLFGK